MREIRASGLRPGDQFSTIEAGVLIEVRRVERYCTGPVAFVEVTPAHALPSQNGYHFFPAETVWVDR